MRTAHARHDVFGSRPGIGGEALGEVGSERIDLVRIAVMAQVPDRQDLVRFIAAMNGSSREKSYVPRVSTNGQGIPSRATAMPERRRKA